jgi:hypothetical protein
MTVQARCQDSGFFSSARKAGLKPETSVAKDEIIQISPVAASLCKINRLSLEASVDSGATVR